MPSGPCSHLGQLRRTTITATDLEVQISSKFKANISEDFLITLPGRKLFDILRSLGNTEIELSSDNDTILLKQQKVSFPFNSYQATSFHCLTTQRVIKHLVQNSKLFRYI